MLLAPRMAAVSRQYPFVRVIGVGTAVAADMASPTVSKQSVGDIDMNSPSSELICCIFSLALETISRSHRILLTLSSSQKRQNGRHDDGRRLDLTSARGCET